MKNEKITLSKNKLVLLSQLLKDIKNIYKEIEGKEMLAYKCQTQRRLVETFFDESNIDIFIDKLKERIYKERVKQQVKQAE